MPSSPPRLISSREALVWAVCFLIVAVLLGSTGFQSADPDSDLYAGLSARLAQEPLSRWVAPEWWGLWPATNMTGYFQEHPVGVLLLPAALARLGVPAGQAAYVAGTFLGLVSILLIGLIVARVASRDDARMSLVLLQLMPVAFLFRIRANHEYGVLVSFLVVLIGVDRVRQSWWALALVATGLAAGLLVKGVFVVLILVGAVLWVLLNPPRTPGSPLRPLVALAIGLGVLVLVALGYDAWYRQVTGDGYWHAYWARQLGQVDVAVPAGGGIATLAVHVGFYLSRLLWHAAPWSLVLAGSVLWLSRGRWRTLTEADRRGLLFAVIYTAILVCMLSPSSRVAERYIFTGTYAAATAGAIIAIRAWPGFARRLMALDGRVPAWPALVWLTLMLARLALGPWIPRINW